MIYLILHYWNFIVLLFLNQRHFHVPGIAKNKFYGQKQFFPCPCISLLVVFINLFMLGANKRSYIFLNKPAAVILFYILPPSMKGLSGFTNLWIRAMFFTIFLVSMFSSTIPIKIVVFCACTQNSNNKNMKHIPIYGN